MVCQTAVSTERQFEPSGRLTDFHLYIRDVSRYPFEFNINVLEAVDLANRLTTMVWTGFGRHEGANTKRTLGSQLATPCFDSYRVHLERPFGDTNQVRTNFGSDVEKKRRRDGIAGVTSKRKPKPQTKREQLVPNSFGIAFHLLSSGVGSIVSTLKPRASDTDCNMNKVRLVMRSSTNRLAPKETVCKLSLKVSKRQCLYICL